MCAASYPLLVRKATAMMLSGDNQGCIWLYYLGEKLRELQGLARSQLEEIKLRGVGNIAPGSMPHIRIDLLTRPIRVRHHVLVAIGIHLHRSNDFIVLVQYCRIHYKCSSSRVRVQNVWQPWQLIVK